MGGKARRVSRNKHDTTVTPQLRQGSSFGGEFGLFSNELPSWAERDGSSFGEFKFLAFFAPFHAQDGAGTDGHKRPFAVRCQL